MGTGSSPAANAPDNNAPDCGNKDDGSGNGNGNGKGNAYGHDKKCEPIPDCNTVTSNGPHDNGNHNGSADKVDGTQDANSQQDNGNHYGHGDNGQSSQECPSQEDDSQTDQQDNGQQDQNTVKDQGQPATPNDKKPEPPAELPVQHYKKISKKKLKLYPTKPDYLMNPVQDVSYQYDAAGNRTSMTADGNTTLYTYDLADRMRQAGEDTFNYDGNGNLIEKTNQSGTVKYTYTGDNMLSGVYYPDCTKVEYSYDALRQKVSRVESFYDPSKIEGATHSFNTQAIGHEDDWTAFLTSLQTTQQTNYLYDGLNVMKEYDQGLQPIAQYYEANGEVSARRMFGNFGRKIDEQEGNMSATKQGELLYYMTDAIGNVMGLTDQSGHTMMKYRYDAFGNLFTQRAAPYNTVGFTGKTYDSKASLMDFSARWYSPKQGRFTTEDTYSGQIDAPQTLNLYAYTLNNPVTNTDPTGHWCESGGYSHDGPCNDGVPGNVDTSNPNYTPDCVHYGTCNSGGSSGGSGGGGNGGSGGGSYTPPPPTPAEIKAGKRQQLVTHTGVSKSKSSSLTKTGGTKTATSSNYGYKPPQKHTQPKPTSSGSQRWTGYYSQSKSSSTRTSSGHNQSYQKYQSVTKSFTSPSKSRQSSHKTSNVLAKTATGIYNFLIGDDIHTLRNPHASTFSKVVAGLSIASNFIPGAGFAKVGAKLGAKFAVEGTIAAIKVFKAPAKAAVKAVSQTASKAVSKVGGFFKGLFGGSSKKATEGTGKGLETRGYKPQPGERTFDGYVKKNVPSDKETTLHTNSRGFNNNSRGSNPDGQFKRFGSDSHAGLSPHVHQPTRNVNKNGEIFGGQGSKTQGGGMTTPGKKDVSQLYDYLNNGKYRR